MVEREKSAALPDAVSKEIISFFREMYRHTPPYQGWHNIYFLIAGSASLNGSHINHIINLGVATSDIDIMIVVRDIVALERNAPIPGVLRQCPIVLGIVTYDVHPGFARLIKEDDEAFVTSFFFKYWTSAVGQKSWPSLEGDQRSIYNYLFNQENENNDSQLVS